MPTKIRPAQIQGTPGAFFAGGGTPVADALRHPGRAFLGDGYQHSQNTDGSVSGGSWLQSFLAGADTITNLDWMEDTARFSVVTSIGIAMSGAARTSGGLDALGVVGLALASTANGKNAWGGYFDAVRTIAGAGSVSGIEVNAAQLPATSPGNSGITDFWRKGKTPYKAPVTGEVSVLNLGGGSDAAVFGRSYAVDAAINIGNNGAAFWAGLNFRFDALMREGVTDDTTSPGNVGYARAISLATEQGISFFSRDPSGAPGSGTQEEAVRLFANVTDAAHRASFSFADGGMTYRERSGAGHGIFTAVYNASVTAGLRVIPGYSGSPAVVIDAHSESGGDANLIAKGAGTGLFGFGTWTANADAAVTGYVTIVDSAGNTRKLATIA